MSAHTPGPWTEHAPDIQGHGIDPMYRRIEAGDGAIPHGFTITGFVSPSDARVIAAAPDLLEALHMLYRDTASYIEVNRLGPVHHNQSMQLAVAALAKAGVK